METVLIVEDEKMIRQGIKSMILRSGVPIQMIMECNNGLMALEILKEQQVDVMFTDIRMPKMDGIALVKEMQQLPYQPITVVVSGYDDFSYAVEMMRMGVREYILKPVDREQIVAIMKRLEEEFIQRKEEQEAKRQISYQQLRYLCMKESHSQEEKEIICKRFHDIFFKKEYVVCCSNHEVEEYEQSDACIYLKNMEGHQVFLVEEQNKGFLLKKELRNCYVGCSQPVIGIEELDMAYRQAKAMRKKAFVEAIKLVSFENGMQLEEEEKELDEAQRHQIENIVHMLGTESVEEAVEAVCEYAKVVKKGEHSLAFFQKQMQFFLTRIMKNYENALNVKEDNVLELQEIYRYQTLDEYMSVLKDWMYKFHELISEEFDDYKNKQKIQQALGYIRENYNKDLNMAVVSNYISMNYSLFSYTFKQYMGKNFVNYIKELRIQEAKKLLEETDRRIVDISQAVGYENEKHFMKLFKAECGVSPTEYRKHVTMKNRNSENS